MNRKVIVAAGLWLLAACLAAAQQAQPTSEPQRVLSLQEIEARDRALMDKANAVEHKRRAIELRMYEDIEIMRRILADKLGSLSQAPLHGSGLARDNLGAGVAFVDLDQDGWLDLYVTNMQSSQQALYRNKGDGKFEDVTAQAGLDFLHPGSHGISTAETVEGYYLKGQGVVYSVSLPVISQQMVKAPTKPARKPISQWERVRKELRGEKVDAQDKSTEHREDTVVDVILKLLAENGHNFSQLTENEQLTIAVTLRTVASGMAPMMGGGGGSGGGMMGMMGAGGKFGMGGGMAPGGGGGPGGGMMGGMAGGGGMMSKMMGGGAKGPGGPGKSGTGVRDAAAEEIIRLAQETLDREQEPQESEAQNHALLGDLHMKQGRYRSAVAAYHKALEAYQKGVDKIPEDPLPARNTPKALRSQLTAVDLYNKLAQAELASGNGDAALKALRRLAEHAQKGETVARKARVQLLTQDLSQPISPTTGAAPSMALPSKLIVSAPKKLLDLVSAGKIGFDEFKKAAAIQYLTFPNSKEVSGGGDKKPKPTASADSDKTP